MNGVPEKYVQSYLAMHFLAQAKKKAIKICGFYPLNGRFAH